MKISPKCPSCLLNRVYMEARMSTDDAEKIDRAVELALKILAEEYPKKGINAVIATRIHRKVYEVLEDEDPYREVKKRANEVSLKYLPEIKRIVYRDDAFRSTAKASIIANTFDYGVMGHEVNDSAFLDYFIRKFRESLKIDNLEKIRSLCKGRVVYLTDNCGEIVYDALFMKEIKKICERLSVVVRGRPIISDATYEDAVIAGVDKIADEVLDNGDGIGIIDEELPEKTKDRIENADIIIAKGMANYECLSDSAYTIGFLLTAKCEPVAKSIGVEVGDMVALLR
ncbi:hypothetical protein Asulf_00158 [Archaeoglobus sulfaticallidus PM70-1]|uniref:Damage-control phosphatase ARMT1-like metal-binding domain-containing protein n=1 Tax=Archaeoglobus sulfaticallidus PM70-1 TaxID=387631 RepID=N0BB19_9EURY|nr:damage-control phosphatase [Archaeoglobus sulfaticallidus]AGK60193.1 hypothetical protein Asulf_00158 [Archaeoglobus sulfaticallidus PM70-1]